MGKAKAECMVWCSVLPSRWGGMVLSAQYENLPCIRGNFKKQCRKFYKNVEFRPIKPLRF